MQLINKIILISIFTVVLAMAQNLKSNEQVIEELFFKELDSLKFDKFFNEKELRLKFETLSDEQKAYCRSRLIKYFNLKGIRVNSAVNQSILVVQEFSPKVKYFESVRQFLGFGNTLTRQVSIEFKAYLDGDQALQNKQFWQIQLSKKDTIKRGDLKRLEESPFTFTRGHWVSYSRWTRYLQPAIVIGSVSALIYLFYSLRT